MTVRVFSSTKLSEAQSRSMSFSRLTTCPLFSIRHRRILYSFFVSSIFSPRKRRLLSPVFSSAPRCSKMGAVG